MIEPKIKIAKMVGKIETMIVTNCINQKSSGDTIKEIDKIWAPKRSRFGFKYEEQKREEEEDGFEMI